MLFFRGLLNERKIKKCLNVNRWEGPWALRAYLEFVHHLQRRFASVSENKMAASRRPLAPEGATATTRAAAGDGATGGVKVVPPSKPLN